MAEALEEEELRILLIGRTGHGKSSVGNTILGIDEFEVSYESQSCTKTCKSKETVRDGIRLVVVDTPGIFDTTVSKPTLMKELLKAVLLTRPGFHVIAFVIQPGRFTEELQETKRLFFEWFGRNVKEYFCIIFTHCIEDDDIQRYTNNPHPELDSLLQDCGGAVFPFENRHTGNSPWETKEKQVRKFLSYVHKLKTKNKEEYFNCLAYNIANAYKDNVDLSDESADLLNLLTQAGLDVQSMSQTMEKLTEKSKNKYGGNLAIFGEIDDECTEDAPNSPVTSPNTTSGIKMRPSSRADRVFVHPESDSRYIESQRNLQGQNQDIMDGTLSPRSNSVLSDRFSINESFSRSQTNRQGQETSISSLSTSTSNVQPSDVANASDFCSRANSPTNQPNVVQQEVGTISSSDRHRRCRKNTTSSSERDRRFREKMNNDENVNSFVLFFKTLFARIKAFFNL